MTKMQTFFQTLPGTTFQCPRAAPRCPKTTVFIFFITFSFPNLVPEVVLNRSEKSGLFHDFGGPFSAISSGIDFSSTFDEIGIQKPAFCGTCLTVLHILSIVTLRVDQVVAFLFVVGKLLNNSFPSLGKYESQKKKTIRATIVRICGWSSSNQFLGGFWGRRTLVYGIIFLSFF